MYIELESGMCIPTHVVYDKDTPAVGERLSFPTTEKWAYQEKKLEKSFGEPCYLVEGIVRNDALFCNRCGIMHTPDSKECLNCEGYLIEDPFMDQD